MAQGDTYTWSEQVVITDCNYSGGEAVVSWGCGGVDCNDNNLVMGATIDEQAPSISFAGATENVQDCIEDGNIVEFEWTLNSGKMYNMSFELERRSSGWIDPNSIEVDTGGGVFFTVASSDFTSTTSTSSNLVSCAPPGENFSEIQFLGALAVVEGPKTIKVRFARKFCCPAACSSSSTNVFGANAKLKYETACGTSRTNNRRNNDVRLASSSSDNVPAYISSGNTEKWKLNLDVAPEWSGFSGNGRYCVDINIDDPLVCQL